MYPAIVLEDGTVIRRESKELLETIRSGQLQAAAGSQPEPAAPEQSPAG